MKKYIIFIISCIGCTNTPVQNSDFQVNLQEHRNYRLKFLRDDFKYQVLKDRIEKFDFESIHEKFDSLNILMNNKNSTEKINRELNKLSDSFRIKLLSIEDDNLAKTVLLQNEIFIYDNIIFNGLKYMNDFSELNANVMMVENSDKLSKYHIFLTASDSMFKPQVELFMKSDTFPVMVENNGEAIITMRKRNNKHSFRGDIILNVHDSIVRYPFSYHR